MSRAVATSDDNPLVLFTRTAFATIRVGIMGEANASSARESTSCVVATWAVTRVSLGTRGRSPSTTSFFMGTCFTLNKASAATTASGPLVGGCLAVVLARVDGDTDTVGRSVVVAAAAAAVVVCSSGFALNLDWSLKDDDLDLEGDLDFDGDLEGDLLVFLLGTEGRVGVRLLPPAPRLVSVVATRSSRRLDLFFPKRLRTLPPLPPPPPPVRVAVALVRGDAREPRPRGFDLARASCLRRLGDDVLFFAVALSATAGLEPLPVPPVPLPLPLVPATRRLVGVREPPSTDLGDGLAEAPARCSTRRLEARLRRPFPAPAAFVDFAVVDFDLGFVFLPRGEAAVTAGGRRAEYLESLEPVELVVASLVAALTAPFSAPPAWLDPVFATASVPAPAHAPAAAVESEVAPA